MRAFILAAAVVALAACDGSTTTTTADGAETPAADGYTMEIRASGIEQTYLITTPEGRTVGARAAEGASALMDENRAQALIADPPPQGEEMPEVMSLRLPGFQMSVSGEEDQGQGENGRVNLSIGGEGRETITVRADEGGPGEADDRAWVRITGADEEAVRDFINEQEELSAEVKAEMFAALGLQ